MGDSSGIHWLLGKHFTWQRPRRRMYYFTRYRGPWVMWHWGLTLFHTVSFPINPMRPAQAMGSPAGPSKIVWVTPIPFPKLRLPFLEVNSYNWAWNSNGICSTKGILWLQPHPNLGIIQNNIVHWQLTVNKSIREFLRAGFYQKAAGSI